MHIKFIQILIPFLTLISCREYDEVSLNDNSSEKVTKSAKKILGRDSMNVDDPLAARDSSETNVGLEEDPPVKHGGHWKVKR